MTDRELLELAAKAAGYGEPWTLPGSDTVYIGPKYELGKPVEYKAWNPLEDDGDALRLAVKLKISTHLRPKRVEVLSWPKPDKPVVYGFDTGPLPRVEASEPYENDPLAATRRAIVRAAAEIGRSMK